MLLLFFIIDCVVRLWQVVCPWQVVSLREVVRLWRVTATQSPLLTRSVLHFALRATLPRPMGDYSPPAHLRRIRIGQAL